MKSAFIDMDLIKLRTILVLIGIGAEIMSAEREYDFIRNPEPENIGNDLNEYAQRLKITEDLVHQLLDRVQILETRDKTLQDRIQTLEMRDENQQHHIQELQTQLTTQRRRTSALERITRRWHQPEFSPPAETGFKEPKVEKVDRIISNRIRGAENEVTVAFTATLSNDILHAGNHQIIIFENVITNVGNAYNGHLGSFIAPVHGIYVFSVTLFTERNISFHANIVKNGQILTWMYCSGSEIGGFDTTSQTVVFQLDKGDDVSIHHRSTDKNLHGYNYSLFSGFLLQQVTSSQIVIGK